MSKFKPLEFLGSTFEVNKICEATVSTLEREFGIKITQEVIVPVIVDCFIDAAIYESLLFTKETSTIEINLFNLLRIINTVNPDDRNDVSTVITLGRMGMRMLEMELEDKEELKTVANIDIKLIEKISMRAMRYVNDRHCLPVRDHQILFKVAEIFLQELLGYVKINKLYDGTLTVFDQFTILVDDAGKFEDIVISESMNMTIQSVYKDVLEKEIALEKEVENEE